MNINDSLIQTFLLRLKNHIDYSCAEPASKQEHTILGLY